MISQEDRGFQRFLDNVQYKCNGILRYERVFGQGFVSTGGIGKPYCSNLSIPTSMNILLVSLYISNISTCTSFKEQLRENNIYKV